LLWTDKYSPRHSGEVVGHSASVNKLHSWLKNWKLRAASDERRDAEERAREEHQIYDSWDCGDFQGEAVWDNGGEEPLCKALLLTGPPGVGKTASVYACAQELGFKVFEVNCSSLRSGRLVLSQLKEATQSHLIEASGQDPLKPAYFSSYNPNSCTSKPELVLGQVKAKPSVTLAHYFKMKQKADRLHFSTISQFGKSAVRKKKANTLQERHQSRTAAMSLILFEEVDIIFEDDVGFLAAIKTFMTTTQRPVILTTNDSSFKERFDRSLEEIIFKTPSAVNVCSYLQQVSRAEEVSLAPDDCSSLFRATRGDVRRCLLQLQLWVHSGGGWTSKTGGPTGSQRVFLFKQEVVQTHNFLCAKQVVLPPCWVSTL
ncbi:ATPase family AAA domain-containing protein 5b, partial [Nematolebias whitei]|uniref:ATPase family AAA domain-containing protein 5b n=1 Tax=Nematolebias whitei TaxID=451745 RepID=UPI00189801E1